MPSFQCNLKKYRHLKAVITLKYKTSCRGGGSGKRRGDKEDESKV